MKTELTKMKRLTKATFLYAAKLRKAGVKVWDKCFAGQIHCLIGLQPGTPAMKDYENLIKMVMNEAFSK